MSVILEDAMRNEIWILVMVRVEVLPPSFALRKSRRVVQKRSHEGLRGAPVAASGRGQHQHQSHPLARHYSPHYGCSTGRIGTKEAECPHVRRTDCLFYRVSMLMPVARIYTVTKLPASHIVAEEYASGTTSK